MSHERVAFIGLASEETLSGICIKGKPRLCKMGIYPSHGHASTGTYNAIPY